MPFSRSLASRATRMTISSFKTRCSMRRKTRLPSSCAQAGSSRQCSLSALPFESEAKLFNCAVVIYRRPGAWGGAQDLSAQLSGVLREAAVHLGNARPTVAVIEVAGERVPFGNDLIFEAENYPDFTAPRRDLRGLWTPIPPSSYAALAGATVLVNLSASNITIGKAEYRRLLCASNRASASRPTSTPRRASANPRPTSPGTAMRLIYENGELLAETERFSDRRADDHAPIIDLERLRRTGCG